MVNKCEWVLIEKICQEEHRSLSHDFQLNLQAAIIQSLHRSQLLSDTQAEACIEQLGLLGYAVK